MNARWIDGWMDERVLSWRYMGWVEGWEQPRTHPELRWTLGVQMPHPHLCPLPTRLPMERAKFRVSNQNTILVTDSRSQRILWGRWDGWKWPLQETPWVSWRLLPQLPWHERQLNLIPGAVSWPKALKHHKMAQPLFLICFFLSKEQLF